MLQIYSVPRVANSGEGEGTWEEGHYNVGLPSYCPSSGCCITPAPIGCTPNTNVRELSQEFFIELRKNCTLLTIHTITYKLQ